MSESFTILSQFEFLHIHDIKCSRGWTEGREREGGGGESGEEEEEGGGEEEEEEEEEERGRGRGRGGRAEFG